MCSPGGEILGSSPGQTFGTTPPLVSIILLPRLYNIVDKPAAKRASAFQTMISWREYPGAGHNNARLELQIQKKKKKKDVA